MEKRIELERRARKANQITELNLDNCRSTSIVGLTDEYTALESLSLINVGLTTLKGFPKLPNLKKLELSDNRISNGLHYLHTSPKLEYLNLSGNKIKDLEALKPLEEFKNLAVLDLFNNEATLIENYREKIFEMLPSLKFLDGYDCNDVEAQSEGEDDEEVNGNDSEEYYKQNAFCLNGLEIDLDEFEEYEKRVIAKKKAQAQNNTNTSYKDDDTDDLDEHLKILQLNESTKCAVTTTTTTASTTTRTNDNSTRNYSYSSADNSSASFIILLYWLLALLNVANAAYRFSDEDDDNSESDEENDDVSLAEVYNDDLEEDNSDWDEEDAGDDDDEEDTDEEDGEADEANETTTAAAAADESASEDKDAAAGNAQAESQNRGKKRKHDG